MCIEKRCSGFIHSGKKILNSMNIKIFCFVFNYCQKRATTKHYLSSRTEGAANKTKYMYRVDRYKVTTTPKALIL